MLPALCGSKDDFYASAAEVPFVVRAVYLENTHLCSCEFKHTIW